MYPVHHVCFSISCSDEHNLLQIIRGNNVTKIGYFVATDLSRGVSDPVVEVVPDIGAIFSGDCNKGPRTLHHNIVLYI